MAEQRVAPGGASTVLLGSQDSKEMFLQHKQQRSADILTPDPSTRFPQGPGGSTTINLGDAAEDSDPNLVRGPVGGGTTIVLGGDDMSAILKERLQERHMDLDTPDAAPRFPQAPGGTTTVCLDSCPGQQSLESITARGPIGGNATICLGSDAASDMFLKQEVVTETGSPRARFPQGPGGDATICLGGAIVEASTAEPRPVGGTASIDLGGIASALGSEGAAAPRGPIGGEDHVVLGEDNTVDAYALPRSGHFETPEAAARFPQAPGGTSSLDFAARAAPRTGTCGPPVGGASSLVTLASWACQPTDFDADAVRGPVGGADSVILGSDDSSTLFSERQEVRDAAVFTPDASIRFPQAPGGTSTMMLGGIAEEDPDQLESGCCPVGGPTTILLGEDKLSEVFTARQLERDHTMETSEGGSRFPQAPGGTSSIELSTMASNIPHADAVSRGPVGGPATLILGTDDACFAQPSSMMETPDPSSRFPQAPGGDSTLILGGNGAGDLADEESSRGGPVGGATTLILGSDSSQSEAFRTYQAQQQRSMHELQTPEAAPRFQQAPGGTSSVDFTAPPTCLGEHAAGGPVGGPDLVVLGIDSSKADFDERRGLREAMMATPDPVKRFPQAPGGSASVILGGDDHRYALNTPANTPARGTPGGSSTLILGGDYPHDVIARVSANLFASNAHQNVGNTLTERPTTRIHHAPGGASTICLGTPQEKKEAHLLSSANNFASNAHQNVGNFLTDRPTTRIHQSPGGDSQINLGGGYPNNDVSDLDVLATPTRHSKRISQSPGGLSNLVLGQAPPMPGSSSKPQSITEFANFTNQERGRSGNASDDCIGGDVAKGLNGGRGNEWDKENEVVPAAGARVGIH